MDLLRLFDINQTKINSVNSGAAKLNTNVEDVNDPAG